MAKDKFDLDMDMDFDLDKELGGIDFGESPSKPPKNIREAIMRTGKDVGRGFKDELFDNKVRTLGKLAYNSIPKSLSAEFSTAERVVTDVKDIMSTSVGELKKQTSGIAKTLAKIVPENGRLSKLLKSVSDKLDDRAEASQQESKEAAENRQIQEGILSALGEMKDKSHADAMLQQAISNKQYASNIEMLKNIYAETKLNRLFSYEISNAYYRKSLELQYKLLFTQREALELQKLAYQTQKNQLESLVMNTALPDYLKARGTEALKYTIAQKGRDLAASAMYKAFNPLEKMTKNITNRVKGFMSDLSEGFSQANMGLEMGVESYKMMSEMGGMSAGTMLGSSAANFLNKYAGGKIGKLIEKSRSGRRGIFNIKNMFADPRSGLDKLSNYYKDSKGLGKYISKGARFLRGFTSGAEKNRSNFFQKDLDESSLFDNRAHTAIVKRIPDLLSRIYGEIKLTRIGLNIKGNGETHMLVWDDNDDSHKSMDRFQRDFRARAKKAMYKVEGTLKMLYQTMGSNGYKLTPDEEFELGKGLLSYYTDRHVWNPVRNVEVFYTKDFLQRLDPTLANKLAKGYLRFIAKLQKNFSELEWINSSILSISNDIPKMQNELENMFKNGQTRALRMTGQVRYDRSSGQYVDHEIGQRSSVLSMYGKFDREAWLTANAGASSSIMGQRVGNIIDSKVSKAKSKVKEWGNKAKDKAMTYQIVKDIVNSNQVQKAVDMFTDTKTKVDEFIQGINSVPKVKKKVEEARKAAKKFIDETNKAISESADAKTLKEQLAAGVDEIAEMTKKIVKGQASEEELENFKKSMAERAKAIKNAGSNLGRSAAKKIDSATKSTRSRVGQAATDANNKFKETTVGKAAYKGISAVDAAVREVLRKASKNKKVQHFMSKGSKAIHFINGGIQQASGIVKQRFNQAKSKFNNAVKTIEKELLAADNEERKAYLQAKLGEAINACHDYISQLQEAGFSEVIQVELENRLSTIVTEARKKPKSSGKKAAAKKVENDISHTETSSNVREQTSSAGSGGFGLPSFGGFGGFDGPEDFSIKSIFKWTRQKDRKYFVKGVGATLTSPLKALAAVFRFGRGLLGGKGTGLSGMIGTALNSAIGAVANPALDMLPMGLGNVIRAPITLLGGTVKALEGIGTALGVKSDKEMKKDAKAKKEKEKKDKQAEKDANNKGSWLNRIKGLWTKKKDDKKKDTGKGGIRGIIDKMKSPTTVFGALLGIYGLSRLTGLGVNEMVSGIKTLVSGVSSIVKFVVGIGKTIGGGIGYIGGLILDGLSKIPGIGGFFKRDDGKTNREAGSEAGSSAGGVAATLGIAGTVLAPGLAFKGIRGLYNLGKRAVNRTKSAYQNDKARKTGGRLRDPKTGRFMSDKKLANNAKVNKFLTSLCKKLPFPISTMVRGITRFLMPIVEKLISMWKTVLSKIKFMKRIITNPKVAQRIGKTALTKVGARIAAFLVPSPLALLGAAFVIWDVGWVLYYMYSEKLTFWQALSKQLLGIDVFNDKELGTITETGEELSEAGRKQLEMQNNRELQKKLNQNTESDALDEDTKKDIYSKRYEEIATIVTNLKKKQKSVGHDDWFSGITPQNAARLAGYDPKKSKDIDATKLTTLQYQKVKEGLTHHTSLLISAKRHSPIAVKKAIKDVIGKKGITNIDEVMKDADHLQVTTLLDCLPNYIRNKNKYEANMKKILEEANKKAEQAIMDSGDSYDKAAIQALKNVEKKEQVKQQAAINNNVKGSTKAETAANIASSQTDTIIQAGGLQLGGDNLKIPGYKKLGVKRKNKLLGKCATYVNRAIVGAGYENYAKGHGYQVGENLEKIGWTKVATFPDGDTSKFKPQKGDVVSFAKSEYTNPEYGHAAIYDGSNWVSDYTQPYMSPYYRHRKESNKYATVYRDIPKQEQESKGFLEEAKDSAIEKWNKFKNFIDVGEKPQGGGPISISSRQLGATNATTSNMSIDTSSMTSVLRQSLTVQIQSRDYLKEIRDLMSASQAMMIASSQQPQAANNMPASVINLKHNYS